MTPETFVQSVTDMKGLLPEMVQSLTAMAPKLTNEERDEAVAKLQPISNEILLKQAEREESIALKDAQLQELKKHRLPEIKNMMIEREQRAADAMIASTNTL